MLQKGNKKIIIAWSFYDWANSVYPLVITSTIFPIFYENITKEEVGGVVEMFGRKFGSSEIYSYAISLSFLIISFVSPALSGIADYAGKKKRFMQFFCYLGALSCASLYFFDTANIALGLLSVVFASIGFNGSLVFYNAFLPEIAEPKDQDKVSAKGFAMGYIGSSILLILNLVMLKVFDVNVRWCFVTVAVWWIAFAQIPFFILPNNVFGHKPTGNLIFKGFKELLQVFKEIRTLPRLKRFLSSFFVYSMGVQTIMIMAVLFAKKEIIGLQDSDLIISILLIQFVGVAGAYLFSKLSSIVGNIKAIGIALFIWILICVGTYLFVYTPVHFYIVAGSVGLVMGGIQSLSRSTYSKLLPDETQDHASYFSFYDVSEKTGIVIGIFLFGYIEGFTGSMRNSILALIAYFIVGFILLLTIPKSNNVK
ncbi:MAG: MFS transporter [Bacteroidota bacterium]